MANNAEMLRNQLELIRMGRDAKITIFSKEASVTIENKKVLLARIVEGDLPQDNACFLEIE